MIMLTNVTPMHLIKKEVRTEKARLEEQAPGKRVYKLATEWMEREITREHGGQKEDSLETKPPQAKVISNAQISQHVDPVLK